MNDREKRSDLFREQVSCLEAIADILQQEQSALLKRDADRLEAVGRLKLERLENLREITVQQRELNAAVPDADELAEQQLRISMLSRHCQQQNASNEVLLGVQQHYVDDLLRLMRGGSASKPGYGRAGQSLATPYGQRPIATA